MKNLIFLLLIFTCLVQAELAEGEGSQPPRYSIVSLGTLPGFDRSRADGLNDKGEVVGVLGTGTSTRPDHVFQWRHGRLQDLGTVPSPYTPNDPYKINRVFINNHGLIVASFSVFFDGAYMGTRETAGMFRNAAWQILPSLPGFSDSSAAAVSDKGDVLLTADHTSSTGVFPDNPLSLYLPHIALYHWGSVTDLGPGCASGLNSRGEISGYVFRDVKGDAQPTFINVQDTHSVSALLLTRDHKTELGQDRTAGINDLGTVIGLTGGAPTGQGYSFKDALPVQWRHGSVERLGLDAEPQAINAQGEIVGGDCLWYNSHRYKLAHLLMRRSRWKALRVSAINSRGQIAGTGRFRGKSVAFLMTPIE